MTPDTYHHVLARNSIVGVLVGSSALFAGCLQTAPTGPGDTPVLNVSNPGGARSVERIGIAGGPRQPGAPATNPAAIDADVTAATNAGPGSVGAGFTGTGGVMFSGPQQVGAGFTGTGDGTNRTPLASFVISPPCLPEQETSLTLTSTSVDPDGDPLLCEWTAPTVNITSDNGCRVSGTAFLNAAGIPIELTVTDNRGGVAVARALLLRCLE